MAPRWDEAGAAWDAAAAQWDPPPVLVGAVLRTHVERETPIGTTVAGDGHTTARPHLERTVELTRA